MTDLVRVTGMAQSRVSTHLGRLREAGFVLDRRKGAQSFYALAANGAVRPRCGPAWTRRPARAIRRSRGSEAAPRAGGRAAGRVPERLVDELERDYSPGRTWQSLAAGIARAAAARRRARRRARATAPPPATLAPYCRSLTCIDTNERLIAAARERLAAARNVRAQVADVHALPFRDRLVRHGDDVPHADLRRAAGRARWPSARACCGRAAASCCSASTSTASRR